MVKNLSNCEHIHVSKSDNNGGTSTTSDKSNNEAKNSDNAHNPKSSQSNTQEQPLDLTDKESYRRMCIERYKMKRRNWTK